MGFGPEVDGPAAPTVIRVSELNRLARLAIERSLPSTWIAGEISNLTRAPSGHWYFTLKDDTAAVRCAMFRNRNQFLDWCPDNGMQVEVRAQATLYEPRGEFQLSVEAMRRAGLGALFEAYQRLKEKLEREGLFDAARKRALPGYPGAIGVVTSPRAAALRDVLTTLRRRWPAARVVVYASLVQGPEAPAQLIAALGAAASRREVDVLLLVRGGGSLEDLWAFNDEALARAIVASPIPVIAGVGHETDISIADFAADLRAPTPTGAAQLATPDGSELRHRITQLGQRILRAQDRRLDQLSQRLDGLSRRLQHPAARLIEQRRHITQWQTRLERALLTRQAVIAHHLAALRLRLGAARPQPAALVENVARLDNRLRRALQNNLAQRATRLQALSTHLSHLNPDAVLSRGYSIVRGADGQIVRDGQHLQAGDAIDLTFAQGGAGARITNVH